MPGTGRPLSEMHTYEGVEHPTAQCAKKICGLSPVVRSNDSVKKPGYYTSHPSGIECWDVTRHMNFNLGNAVKYIWRCDLKDNPIQDLEKAIEYLQDEIAMQKGER